MIRTEGIKKVFWDKKEGEVVALHPTSLSVNEGEVFGVLGPNGAGKTTLLRMLATILTPTDGSGEVNGYDILSQKEEVKSSIGFLSGNTKLYGRLTPTEILNYFGELYGLGKEEIRVRKEELITLLNMEEFIDKKVEKLSTGQTQKVSIARALLHDPDIYMLDEPTLGLDILTSKSIIEFIRGEAGRGKTIIFSTHYMEEAEVLCDRVALLHKGRILDIDTTEGYYNKCQGNNLRDIFFEYVNKSEGDINES
ncbi:ABC transporter ATP-binding protein [Halonatronum saccharophilum]|uniref:ABC transporter ATP-binding protein n=1 Tax=Halonatronum saccharophilum TaxID=150060 RepID=UPI0004AD6052|nr:ATP-binding cassette domain-containing protein [Halonatronum saccharophilum]